MSRNAGILKANQTHSIPAFYITRHEAEQGVHDGRFVKLSRKLYREIPEYLRREVIERLHASPKLPNAEVEGLIVEGIRDEEKVIALARAARKYVKLVSCAGGVAHPV